MGPESWSNCNLKMLFFVAEGEPEFNTEKTLGPEQGRNQLQTQLMYGTRLESNHHFYMGVNPRTGGR